MGIGRENLANFGPPAPGVVRFSVATDSDTTHYGVGGDFDSDNSCDMRQPTLFPHWEIL